jgi:hypothetical protein
MTFGRSPKLGRSLVLAIAIAAFPEPGYPQLGALCDQPFDGDIVGLYARIKEMPGAVVMQSPNPNFQLIQVELPRARAEFQTWNFTIATHPAHPSVACRRFVQQEDGAWNARTDIQCRAAKAQCDKLADDYRALDKQLRDSIRRTYPEK